MPRELGDELSVDGDDAAIHDEIIRDGDEAAAKKISDAVARRLGLKRVSKERD